MSLKHVRETYEGLGAEDPFYAVLSLEGKGGGKWDRDELFETGKREIADALAHVEGQGLSPARHAALDFGCGVGRLTQALGEHFERVVGVDISSSMVACAEENNQLGDRCEYVLNQTDHLKVFPDESFDFVYSNIALQHSPPQASAAYIAEFVRLLRPNGVALFHIPSGPLIRPGSLREVAYNIKSGVLRRAWKRVRGKATVEMHYLHHSQVEGVIHRSGARLVHAERFGSQHRKRYGMRYCVAKS